MANPKKTPEHKPTIEECIYMDGGCVKVQIARVTINCPILEGAELFEVKCKVREILHVLTLKLTEKAFSIEGVSREGK